MTVQSSDRATSESGSASRGEHAKLRRELGRLDTIFFLISAMVVVDTIGAIAVGGGQAFTWLVVLFVFFFIPSALASAELGAAIPAEGGPYVWVRTAFGRYAGSLTSLLYWAGTPMWLGGSVTIVAITVWQRFVSDLATSQMYVFGVLFITAATVAAVVPLRYGKWVPNSGAVGQIVLLAFFTLTVVIYGTRHGVHGISVGDLTPSTSVFIAVVPVLIYSFVGVELPSTAGEEMVDPRRDIPIAIFRAGVGQALMYALPILAVLVVLPAGQITSLHGLIDAMKTVFTVYGGSVSADGTATLTGAGQVLGWVGAAVFIWVLLASGAAWIMGAGRVQAAACLDGAGPRVLGRISTRSGVPVVMGVLSGLVSMAVMLVDLAATRGDGQKYFSAALTAAIALIVLAYLLIFPSFLVLRLRRSDIARPFLVPGGLRVAWLVTILATGWSLLATLSLLWPGVGTSDPDAALPRGFEGQRLLFELLVLSPVAAVVLAATAFFWWSRGAGTETNEFPAQALSAVVRQTAIASAPSARKEQTMGNPVVHFEVIGTDGPKLHAYFSELFGWEIDANNPMGYGLVAREGNTNAEGIGIGGGVAGGPEGYGGHVTFYVEVPDVDAALAKAESLGGKRVMGPEQIMDGVVLGQFLDPEGHVIGLTQATS